MTTTVVDDIAQEFQTIEKAQEAFGDLYSPEVNAVFAETITEVFFPGITLEKLFEKLIHKASLLCADPETTHWGLIAGTLRTLRHTMKVKMYDVTLEQHIKNMVADQVYGPNVLERTGVFTSAEIAELEGCINKGRDLDLNTSAMIIAMNKYLRPFKDPRESVQQMFMVNAMIIASSESDPAKRILFARELYDALSLRKLSLATPWLSNLRGDGNISSCFILEIGDSLESITKGWADIAQISKQGGGVGVFLGSMRAKGAVVNGVKNAAKGINSWTKIINDIASTVDQGGIRKGAVTIALPIWHNDIEDFYEIQSEVGDPRSKSYDIFPQVTIPDIFMRRLEANQEWFTFCPNEVLKVLGIDIAHIYNEEFEEAYIKVEEAIKAGQLKLFKHYKARDLYKHQMRAQIETGMPYVAYIDAINRANPNKAHGTIPCVNLCTESFSVVAADKYTHCCNLASVVLTNIHTSADLEHVTRLATRVLEYGITLTNPPTEYARVHNESFRTIGIGITGLHDFLAREFIQFSNAQFIGNLAKQIEFYAISESVQLAKEYGAYAMFDGSEWQNGNKIASLIKHSLEHCGEGYNKQVTDWMHEDIGVAQWTSLQEEMSKYGIRNSQLTSPAPNTGTSVFTESSASILPIYSAFFIESNGDGLKPQYGKFIKENPLHYARNISAYSHAQLIDYVSEMQRFIDTGISFELVFDHNDPSVNAKYMYDTYVYAWKKQLKSIYYMRTVKKGNSILNIVSGADAKEVCVGCAG